MAALIPAREPFDATSDRVTWCGHGGLQVQRPPYRRHGPNDTRWAVRDRLCVHSPQGQRRHQNGNERRLRPVLLLRGPQARYWVRLLDDHNHVAACCL